MTTTNNDDQKPPIRGSAHDALDVFLGSWKAEGRSFGGTDQSGTDPRANGVAWTSTHVAYWHTGEFFMIEEEKARPGGDVFDTLGIMGVDPATGQYFARAFENHGFYRHYQMKVDGRVWSICGDSERARIEFSEDVLTQTITWEWKPKDKWLPLCDRVAMRTNDQPQARPAAYWASLTKRETSA